MITNKYSEREKILHDEDLMAAICMALRKSAESKANKDWKKVHDEKVLEEDRKDC